MQLNDLLQIRSPLIAVCALGCALAVTLLASHATGQESETIVAEESATIETCCSGSDLNDVGDAIWSDWIAPKNLGYRGPALTRQFGERTQLSLWGNVRGFFSADHRVDFTGQEFFAGAEASTMAKLVHDEGAWQSSVTGELYFNQPFDRNVLVDYPLRESFSHNFEIETLEISQLFISAKRNDWTADFGKFLTPFGRFRAPLISNVRNDAPFIRTESIQFRETGFQLRYEPNALRLAAAITNGGENRDTNSSKAIIARAGFDTGNLAGGASVKWQDGIGSEGQKEFNNHAGVDFAIKRGRLTLSSEWIYDQYGLRRPGFNLDDIDWGRSIYNRQLNNGLNVPLSGWGWYANAVYRGDVATTVLQYGEFHPDAIGDNIHDQVTRRVSSKYIRRISERLDFYVSAVFENRVENAQDGRFRKGTYILSGVQFNF